VYGEGGKRLVYDMVYRRDMGQKHFFIETQLKSIAIKAL
jgi:hypothetical protein